MARPTKVPAQHLVGSVLIDIWEDAKAALLKAAEGKLDSSIITLTPPPNPTMGDLAFPCFILAKQLKQQPAAVAKQLAEKISSTKWIEQCHAAGPYVNFRLQRSEVALRVLTAIQEEPLYGHSERDSGEHLLIEYVQPNTNKPLHLGHVRNGLLGMTLARLWMALGTNVTKVNIVNDRGIHIAKSMLAYERWGNSETPESTAEKGDHFVGRYYVRFEQELQKERSLWMADQTLLESDQEKESLDRKFLESSTLMAEARDLLRKWEAGDPHVHDLWKSMNAWVLAGFATTYKLLGFEFDKEYFESQIYTGGRDLIMAAAEKGVFRKDEDGSVIAPLQEKFGIPDKVLLRKDGTSLYVTQDINLAHLKFEEFHPDMSIYVVGSEQDLYFQQLFAVLKLMAVPWADHLLHLSYGMVNLPEGKMKSREGKVVDADDLIAELLILAEHEVATRYTELSPAEQQRRARAIAIAGLKFHFLLVGKDSAMTYDPKASISFEGNTGPYLQYTYARARSILRKAGDQPVLPSVLETTDDGEWVVVRSLLAFPGTVAQAAHEYDPATLANALLELAQQFNTFYHDQPVLKAPEPVRSARLALVASVATVLKNGLGLMGIETLEEM